jgi:hypothetical protein
MTTHRPKAGNKWKAKAKITDRDTANRAKVYIYGLKAFKRLEEVQKTNVCIADCMRPLTVTPDPDPNSYSNSIRFAVFVLCLYMVWSLVIT